MDNYFQNIFPKTSGSQEDNQISIFGCPHSFFGHRGHEDTRILLPCNDYFFHLVLLSTHQAVQPFAQQVHGGGALLLRLLHVGHLVHGGTKVHV